MGISRSKTTRNTGDGQGVHELAPELVRRDSMPPRGSIPARRHLKSAQAIEAILARGHGPIDRPELMGALKVAMSDGSELGAKLGDFRAFVAGNMARLTPEAWECFRTFDSLATSALGEGQDRLPESCLAKLDRGPRKKVYRDESAALAIASLQAKLRRGSLNTRDLFNCIKAATHSGKGDLFRQFADLREFAAAHQSHLSRGAQALFSRFKAQIYHAMDLGVVPSVQDRKAMIDDLRGFLALGGGSDRPSLPQSRSGSPWPSAEPASGAGKEPLAKSLIAKLRLLDREVSGRELQRGLVSLLLGSQSHFAGREWATLRQSLEEEDLSLSPDAWQIFEALRQQVESLRRDGRLGLHAFELQRWLEAFEAVLAQSELHPS